MCGPETLRVKDDLREDEYLIYRLIFPLRIIPLPELFIDRDIRVSENLNLGLERLIWKKNSKRARKMPRWIIQQSDINRRLPDQLRLHCVSYNLEQSYNLGSLSFRVRETFQDSLILFNGAILGYENVR